MADAHALRELAFIYAFEGRYDLASDAISQARRLGPSNPYIIDMQAFVLLEQYRRTKEATLLRELDACIERLEEADARENTNFSRIRKGMREVFAHNHLDEMRVLFNSRSSLPLHAKFSLLDTLGAKGRWDQFEQLASELQANVKKNPLADIELARIRIIYFAFDGKISDAEHLLNRYRHKFTDYCIQFLQKQILDARARTGAK
jgi:tetratricopeptide (TPR) repeat protein